MRGKGTAPVNALPLSDNMKPYAPFLEIVNTWGSISRKSILRFLQVFPPLQYLQEIGNDLKLPAAMPSHCKVVDLLPRTM